jgi:hypothetical protein
MRDAPRAARDASEETREMMVEESRASAAVARERSTEMRLRAVLSWSTREAVAALLWTSRDATREEKEDPMLVMVDAMATKEAATPEERAP